VRGPRIKKLYKSCAAREHAVPPVGGEDGQKKGIKKKVPNQRNAPGAKLTPQKAQSTNRKGGFTMQKKGDNMSLYGKTCQGEPGKQAQYFMSKLPEKKVLPYEGRNGVQGGRE